MSEDVEFKFGKGLISDYLSALLGVLSLMGILCFYYPEVFTSE